MDYIAHTEEYKGYTINVRCDNIAESPREWDNLGTITAWHRNYNLSDERHNYDVETFVEEVVNDKNTISLPLYIYEHGGIALSTAPFSCRWDSGQVGWIHVSKDKIRKEYGVTRITKKVLERVLKVLESEVDTYGKYVNGEVYGFEILDADGEYIDSCWGFIGDSDDKYMLETARDVIDCEEATRLPLLAHAKLLEA